MLGLSRSLSRIETQDMKTHRNINQYLPLNIIILHNTLSKINDESSIHNITMDNPYDNLHRSFMIRYGTYGKIYRFMGVFIV